MSRIWRRTRISCFVWAVALLSAGPVFAQAPDPAVRTALPFGRPAVQPARPHGTVTRPVEPPPAAVPPAARVAPLDNGRSRSPFLRSLDPDTPNLTPRPGEPGADLFRARPDTYRPRPDQPMPQRGHRPGSLGRRTMPDAFGMPYYGWPVGSVAGVVIPTAPSQPSTPPDGYLRLRVSPRSSDVFVDGAYAGTADEFGGVSDRALSAGPHRVELRAGGYEPVAFDVRVPANDTLTYRRDLTPVDEPAAVAVPQAGPPPPHKTMYVVPGCYAGDVPPQAGQLPARCDLADLRIIP